MASLSLKLELPSNRALLRIFLDEVAKLIAGALQQATKPVQERVGKVAVEALQSCPEYLSLLTGQLWHELGPVNAAPILAEVVRNIREGLVVTSLGARRAGENISGGLIIELVQADYSEVLRVQGASFASEGGHTIDWLRWLTLEGDRILVADYHFVAGNRGRSRTGDGIMAVSGSWRVPAEFSGTADNNWIVRALAGIIPAVDDIAAQEIERGF